MKNLLGACLALLILSSCQHYVVPKSEICINGDQGGICHDARKPEGERAYILPYADMLNYISTNPQVYG